MQSSTQTSLANDHVRITPDNSGSGYAIEVADGSVWAQLGTGSFGRLVTLDAQGERQETPIVLDSTQSSSDSLTLSGSWTSADGVTWQLSTTFTLLPDPRQVRLVANATPSGSAKVVHFSGPTLYAGEDSFGAHKTDAIFPGLEYLGQDEPSSSTSFASETYAGRAIPHPYKIAVPMMAVSHEGKTLGLIWDPNQEYGSAWRHPAAVFSSPNKLDGQENHLMGLFAPGVPRFTDENSREAKRSIGAARDKPLRLEANIVALTDATSIDVLKTWVDTYGLPALDPPHSYAENVDLSVGSYLDIAWDEAAEGWHHTLADPWGARYEPRVIAQLWRYSQWGQGNPELKARAREQAERGLAKALVAGSGSENSQYSPPIPHLELALHAGHLEQSLHGTSPRVDQLIDSQQADGSWPWKPELIAHETYNTDEMRKVMGGEDSSTGITAERAQHLLSWALMTSDEKARDAGLRAIAWCNAQTRPEGAQTWELHLHVPDLLAVPYLIDGNLLAHQLTGDAGYLDRADRWAWTGLPFTYLWQAYFRPIMPYATVPVFGVTFHDVQSWFGVMVQWNGLIYADALLRLADAKPDSHWRQIALGIVACGMQQQPLDGPWRGMYPDAFSLVRGEEEYTWWLNPNLIGLNTFELAGLPLDVRTTRIADGSIAVTSGANVVSAESSGGTLQFLLEYPAGNASHSIVSGAGKPAGVRAGGVALTESTDLDPVSSGWRWLPENALLIVKAPHASEPVSVEITS